MTRRQLIGPAPGPAPLPRCCPGVPEPKGGPLPPSADLRTEERDPPPILPALQASQQEASSRQLQHSCGTGSPMAAAPQSRPHHLTMALRPDLLLTEAFTSCTLLRCCSQGLQQFLSTHTAVGTFPAHISNNNLFLTPNAALQHNPSSS